MTYHLLRMKQCPMLVPTLLCCRGVYVLQAELCSKKSYKTSSSNEIVKVPGTCFVQPAPAPAAPSPARPCSDESAVGFPALERELPSLGGHLQYKVSGPLEGPEPSTSSSVGPIQPSSHGVAGSAGASGFDNPVSSSLDEDIQIIHVTDD
ncbi:uncharacterized protein LOC135095862 [Scylla paramamosain]|uniref:uncharacterized protein LOC135095862 n=1 Tax=Scylla paramamosain TaxID=85552 RepID=UPI003083C762